MIALESIFACVSGTAALVCILCYLWLLARPYTLNTRVSAIAYAMGQTAIAVAGVAILITAIKSIGG